MSGLIKLGSRNCYATVKEFQGMVRVHIRRYSCIDGRAQPTKFGAALSIKEFKDLQSVTKQLNEMVDSMIDTNTITQPIENNQTTLLKLGSRGYHATVNVFKTKVKIHLGKYIDIAGKKNVPMIFGIALTIPEFEDLKMIMNELTETAEVMYTNLLNKQQSEQSDEANQETANRTVNEPPRKKLYLNTDDKICYFSDDIKTNYKDTVLSRKIDPNKYFQ